jgi:UDP-3-O-acyl-N-acetylglucosamine deacetylase
MVDHVFEREVAPARSLGLAGLVDPFDTDEPGRTGLLDDRIDLGKWRLRYHDEFARYKMLECFGDLALAGSAIFGHLFVHQPGHRVTLALLQALFANRGSWNRLSYDAIHDRIVQDHGEQALQAKLRSMRPH